jgi:glutamate formiminotransferase
VAADTLLAIPNVSEGRDAELIAAIGDAYVRGGAGAVHLLDVHTDADHHRSVHTLAGPPGSLAPAIAAGAAFVVEHLDVRAHPGAHPHVGALDVAPVVHLDHGRRGAACAEALVAGHLLGQLGLPVLLYGTLAGGRRRADVRRGGPAALGDRLAAGELRADFGPQRLHPTAGAVLVGARPPLVAFNVELAPPATPADAQRIAALLREGGAEGLPGLRALGLSLPARDGVAQVSMNVEDHVTLPLAVVVEAIRRHAPVSEAELVGLAPAAAFDGFPGDVPVRNRRTVAEALEVVGL